MSNYTLSEAFYFELADGDIVWPTTVSGQFRLSPGGKGHNVLGVKERPVSESQMVEGVLLRGEASRFRSKTNEARRKNTNHFSVTSPSVKRAFVKSGSKYVPHK